MQNEFAIRPVNSVIFISDPGACQEVVPSLVAGQIVAANAGMITVGTLSETDGSTTIVVKEGDDATVEGAQFVFDLELPTQRVALSDAQKNIYFERTVSVDTVRIALVVNDVSEPDRIEISVCTD